MRRSVKPKIVGTRIQMRKTATSASPATRGAFPAWIDADERSVAFSAKTAATPRVRDALVLRTVARNKSVGAKRSRHAGGNQ